MSTRGDVLDEAKAIVDGDRNTSYGNPEDNFARTARLINAQFGDQLNFEFSPHDVAVLMMLLKIARLWESPEKRDTWIDIAGYAACGFDAIDSHTAVR